MIPTLNYEKIAASHPALARGKVWCKTCGREERVDSAECLRSGWPLCHGSTMTIDNPTGRSGGSKYGERDKGLSGGLGVESDAASSI